jgi:hypothetical protein
MVDAASGARGVGVSVVDFLTARVWWVFGIWLALLGALHAMIWAGHGWVWFPLGARLLFSSSWSHLYAAHNDLQIGPLAFVIVAPIVFGLPSLAGEVTAMVLMCAGGLVVLSQIRGLRPVRSTEADRAFLLAGLCFLSLWAELAVTFGHVDDVLAIIFTVSALRAFRSDRPYMAAVLLGLGADCKPWAVMFVPLVLLAERRTRVPAVAIWIATILSAWLPFYLADHRTLTAATYRIPNNLASSLRVLGENASSTPSWDRPAQLALAIMLGLVLMRRGRWSAVIVVAVAARILLDPAVTSYYDAGLLTGAIICDTALLAGPIPALSLSAVLVFYLPMFPLHAQPHVYGLIRATYLLTLIAALVALPDDVLRDRARRPDQPRPLVETTDPAAS